jgi:acyl-CoA reductase-like NAD-dependent aldehyde dehydrogenase
LARLITLENGKPFAESVGEMNYAISFCEWFGHEGRRLSGQTMPSPFPNQRIMTLRQPIGVVGMITPWNFPAAMITRKAAPALTVGCTVVLKPSEDTPLTALALAHLAIEAGLPPACFSVLPSSRANSAAVGAAICSSPLVRAISFTGSTAVGQILLKQSADTVKKVSLELGGLGPFIVFPSANLEHAAMGLLAAKFRNTGQACIAANNVFVHRDVLDDFIAVFLAKVRSLQFGDPFQSGTTLGPLINSRGLDKVREQVQDAIGRGATLHCGGKSIDDYHFEPTLLSNVPQDAQCFNSETFGPLCAIKVSPKLENIFLQPNSSLIPLTTIFGIMRV